MFPVGTAFFHVDGRKDGRKVRHTDREDEIDGHFSGGNFAHVRKYLELFLCLLDRAPL